MVDEIYDLPKATEESKDVYYFRAADSVKAAMIDMANVEMFLRSLQGWPEGRVFLNKATHLRSALYVLEAEIRSESKK